MFFRREVMASEALVSTSAGSTAAEGLQKSAAAAWGRSSVVVELMVRAADA
jgi:hypothetical protein